MAGMKKSWQVLARILKISVSLFFIYRANFIYGVTASLTYGILYILLFWLVFQAGKINQIAGYSLYEIYFIFSLSQILVMLNSVVIDVNVRNLQIKIDRGRLDDVLMRPWNSLLAVSFGYIRLRDVVSLLFYVFFVGWYVMPHLSVVWNLIGIAKLTLIMTISLVLYWVLSWLAAFVWFFWPKMNAFRLMINTVYDINRFPREIYPQGLSWFLIYILPIFLIVNPVFLWLKGSYHGEIIFRDLGVMLIFVLVYAITWREGLKRYSSAN